MKIKTLWSGIFIFLAFFSTESKATEESWRDYLASYVPRLDTFIPAVFSSSNSTYTDELPDCFVRTNYTPQEYSRDAYVLLSFDLSDENVGKMNSLWYCSQSLIAEKNPRLSNSLLSNLVGYLKESGYEPNPGLNKEQLILDSYCVLANKGFPLALCKLADVFDYGMYGQRKNRKLGYLFGQYGAVGNIKAMREGQTQCKRILAEFEKEVSDDEEDLGTLSTARNSSDESFCEEQHVDSSKVKQEDGLRKRK